MQRYLARLSPIAAIRDLRVFLAQRQPYELGILALSIVLTTLLIAGFVHDSHEERPYRHNIIYVEQWPASRTEAEIRADQKITQAAKDKKLAEEARRQKALQAQFKKIDDRLKALGI
jgi:hypothetical protein